MINKVAGSIIPRTVLSTTAKKPDRMTKFMQSKTLAKICDISGSNPVLATSLFSLGVCLALRPATTFAITKDKKDAAYSSGHSIASGTIGFIWPLLIVTPITAAITKVFKNPAKFLNPKTLKKFYPQVGLQETVGKDGKKTLKAMVDKEGNLLKQDGSLLYNDLTALMVKNGDAAGQIEDANSKIAKYNKRKEQFGSKKIEISDNTNGKLGITKVKNYFQDKIKKVFGKKIDNYYQNKIDKQEDKIQELKPLHEAFLKEKAKFEAENPKLYVDSVGVVRSKEVFKTKNGKFQYDKQGRKIGAYVQQDKTPVTEEIERGINKESNTKDVLKYATDILLAPPRAILTIACIPPVLSAFGLEKRKKEPVVASNSIPYKSVKGIKSFKSTVSNINKKGGV